MANAGGTSQNIAVQVSLEDNVSTGSETSWPPGQKSAANRRGTTCITTCTLTAILSTTTQASRRFLSRADRIATGRVYTSLPTSPARYTVDDGSGCWPPLGAASPDPHTVRSSTPGRVHLQSRLRRTKRDRSGPGSSTMQPASLEPRRELTDQPYKSGRCARSPPTFRKLSGSARACITRMRRSRHGVYPRPTQPVTA